MPHLPDSHHDHDLVLIAALAAGDAEGADLTHARELVASCTECARVRDDLITLAAQLRTLPAPRRTRDYRLTDDQAARLRPAGWRRLLGTFGSSGFRFATPLGSAMATLGLAGLLLANTGTTAMGGPSGAGQGSVAAGGAPAFTFESPSGERLTGSSAQPDASDVAALPAASGDIPKASASAAPASTAPSVDASGGIQAARSAPATDPAASDLDPVRATGHVDTTVSSGVPVAPMPLLFASVVLLIVGATLVLLRAVSRRATLA